MVKSLLTALCAIVALYGIGVPSGWGTPLPAAYEQQRAISQYEWSRYPLDDASLYHHTTDTIRAEPDRHVTDLLTHRSSAIIPHQRPSSRSQNRGVIYPSLHRGLASASHPHLGGPMPPAAPYGHIRSSYDSYYVWPGHCQKIGTYCCGAKTHILATCGGSEFCHITFSNIHTYNYTLQNGHFTDLSGRYWLIPVVICNVDDATHIFLSAC